MPTFIVILAAVTSLCLSSAAHCQSLAALSIRGEDSLMKAMETRHREIIEEQYRKYLSSSKANIEIADLEIETRQAPSKDDIGSYDINLYYVDPSESGCTDRLLQIAMHGAALAHRLTDVEIGSITAIPVFPGFRGKETGKMRAVVVITYYLLEKKELFARIADGELRKGDMAEMNSWLRAWKELPLDPKYDARITFK
jgi:hypothetical protein